MAGDVILASDPTDGHGIGVFGALLLNTEEGVDTFGRLDSPFVLRSD